jgi:hypothetical protein
VIIIRASNKFACVDTDTGELSEHRLAHREEAEAFYRILKQRNLSARVGMESSGHSRWFERLLHELGFELWIGDPAEIQTRRGTPLLGEISPVRARTSPARARIIIKSACACALRCFTG